jgi:hypothetical protein
MAPGLDFFKSSDSSSDVPVVQISPDAEPEDISVSKSAAPEAAPRPGVYYNSRLDPKNFLEGELSVDAATRLRQMLARPGIVVSPIPLPSITCPHLYTRLPPAFVMVSVPVAHSKPVSIACTKVVQQQPLHALACPTSPLLL